MIPAQEAAADRVVASEGSLARLTHVAGELWPTDLAASAAGLFASAERKESGMVILPFEFFFVILLLIVVFFLKFVLVFKCFCQNHFLCSTWGHSIRSVGISWYRIG